VVPCGGDLEFFVPDSLPVKLDGEFALVGGEERPVFLRLGGDGGQHDCARGENAGGGFQVERISDHF
jgi:hypothetical protein